MTTRIQRSRERGSRQPVNTKYCGRPTEWGNPFPIGEEYTRTEAMEAFRKAFWAHELHVTPARARTELAAYDYLSCWCRLDQPCHVDEYIRAIFCEHTLSVTLTGAIAQYAGHVCTGASPSRAHGLPARTAARPSSAGERREHIQAQSVNTYNRDVNAAVHSAIHTSQPLQSLKRLLAPGVPRRHLRRLPAPMRLHRLQRSAPPGHPDGQSHTPRTARILIPRPAALAMPSTRRLICDIDSPDSGAGITSESSRSRLNASSVSGMIATLHGGSAWTLFAGPEP